jgi:hypothetical protein
VHDKLGASDVFIVCAGVVKQDRESFDEILNDLVKLDNAPRDVHLGGVSR